LGAGASVKNFGARYDDPMRAFQVELNGKRICTAGVGADGVLTAILDYVGGERGDRLSLSVGGLTSPAHEHVIWRQVGLKVGDLVAVKVVEAESIDKPRKRYRKDPKAEEKNQKALVRVWARKFGWRIVTQGSR
jgi:hypothetical protein